jgi:hypothetical protein
MALSELEMEFCRLQAEGMDAGEAARQLGLKNVMLLAGRPDISAQVRVFREQKDEAETVEERAEAKKVLAELGIVPDDEVGDKLLGLDDVQQLMQKALKTTSGNPALAREAGNLLVAISRIAEKREDRQRGQIDVDKVSEGELKRLSEPELREFVQGVVARMKK